MNYRTKPSPVTAVQWWKHGDHPSNKYETYDFLERSYILFAGKDHPQVIFSGDYLIDHPDGRVEHCPQGEFPKRFEAVITDGFTCPFCEESDFDLIGLKMHLMHGQCGAYQAINISPTAKGGGQRE